MAALESKCWHAISLSPTVLRYQLQITGNFSIQSWRSCIWAMRVPVWKFSSLLFMEPLWCYCQKWGVWGLSWMPLCQWRLRSLQLPELPFIIWGCWLCDFDAMIQAIVTSRLDYGNSFYVGLPLNLTWKFWCRIQVYMCWLHCPCWCTFNLYSTSCTSCL